MWNWPACRVPWRFFYFILFIANFSKRLWQYVYVGCTDFLPCKRLFVQNTSFVCKAKYCVHIQLGHLSRLVRMSTTLRVKRLIAYIYAFCDWRNLCVRVKIFALSDLFRTYTTSAIEATDAYKVWILRVSDLWFKVFLDCVNMADVIWSEIELVIYTSEIYHYGGLIVSLIWNRNYSKLW